MREIICLIIITLKIDMSIRFFSSSISLDILEVSESTIESSRNRIGFLSFWFMSRLLILMCNYLRLSLFSSPNYHHIQWSGWKAISSDGSSIMYLALFYVDHQGYLLVNRKQWRRCLKIFLLLHHHQSRASNRLGTMLRESVVRTDALF